MPCCHMPLLVHFIPVAAPGWFVLRLHSKISTCLSIYRYLPLMQPVPSSHAQILLLKPWSVVLATRCSLSPAAKTRTADSRDRLLLEGSVSHDRRTARADWRGLKHDVVELMQFVDHEEPWLRLETLPRACLSSRQMSTRRAEEEQQLAPCWPVVHRPGFIKPGFSIQVVFWHVTSWHVCS